MLRSFQIKLALLSTLVSGLVLTLFALVFWQFIVVSHQDRLDRDLAGLAHQMLLFGSPSVKSLHLSQEQVAIFGEELVHSAILVTDLHHNIVHQTGNWPQEVTAQILPEATKVDRTRLPDHGHFENEPHTEHSNHGLHQESTMVEPQFKTVHHSGKEWRLVGLSDSNHTLHVALDLATFNSNLHHIRVVLLLAIGVALLAFAFGAGWVARRALKPIKTLTDMAESITASGLDQRIENKGSDLEFERLIHVFNQMLERLDTSFRQAVRFSADASHELKTPLTIMQGEVETALQNAPSGSDVQQTLASQLDEIRRLNQLVSKLLLLSHADSGGLLPTGDRFDFSELVLRVCEDIPALGPDLKVECHVDPAVQLQGDPELLRQAVQNLVFNAIGHNLPNGWIRCELTSTNEKAVLRISNSAKPIAAIHRDKIFHRFYRLDKARSGDHVGLGLSLSWEIARVHRGQLSLLSSDPSGTTFEMILPL